FAERLLQVFVAHGVRQVADVKFIAHGDSSDTHKTKRWGPESTTNLEGAAVARETDRSPGSCTDLFARASPLCTHGRPGFAIFSPKSIKRFVRRHFSVKVFEDIGATSPCTGR